MYRGFFCFLQMKNRQFKRSRGRQLFWLCFDVGVVALHGAWIWLEMCMIIFTKIIFRQSSIFKSECYISFASLQRQFNLLAELCIHMCSHACACVCFIPLFLNSSFWWPKALNAETWLLFFFFLGQPLAMLKSCNWACFLLLVECGVQTSGCRVWLQLPRCCKKG